MMRYLSLVLLATSASSVYPQTWEESNDPNNLCSDSYSGYRATLDCRGYVYCNEGYLMGGDVIPCWPNQLFDEVNAVCTTWQSVTESLGDDISWKCPEYDASLMVPDDTDGNANPQLFFCGTSTFNAKSVCEPCPGGIRTECSDPSHNCYAGITGCPVNPNPSPTPPAVSVVVSEPNPPPATPEPTPNPTPMPTPPSTDVEIELTIAAPTGTDSNNDGDRTDSFYLHGKLRTSYYCGSSWDLVLNTCSEAFPCPSGLNTECPMGQTCFPDTPCNELQTARPTPNPTGKPTTTSEGTYYCGPDWQWVVTHCSEAVPCPYGDASAVCPDGYKCIADTPCNNIEPVGANPVEPTPIPTRHPTFPPVEGDDPDNRYCGHNWSDVTENCLTAIPCPGGVAFGVCPDGMNCIAETPCKDEEYLSWLRDKQEKVAAEMAEAEALGSMSDEGNEYCTNNDDCNSELMCNNGFCSTCLDDGTGCSMEQICKPVTCGETQAPGPTHCFSMNDLDTACRVKLNDARAVCVIDVMDCEISMEGSEEDFSNLQITDESGGNTVFDNPEGNSFFCGDDYYAIKSSCLQSKPCPGGFASSYCNTGEGEGCFSVSECQSEYEAAANDEDTSNDISDASDNTVAATSPSNVSETDKPTTTPTKSPSVPPLSSPTARPSQAATTSPTNEPISPAPTNFNSNYCGVSWSSHADDCENARPCPRGDECEASETCFSDSPCAALKTSLNGTTQMLVNGEDMMTGADATEESSEGSIQDETAQSDVGENEFTSSDASQSSLTITTTNPFSSLDLSEGDPAANESEQLNTNVAEKASEEVAPTSLEYCNICGSAGKFSYDSYIDYDGLDGIAEMPCGEMIWVFARNNIYEGSSECLATRSKYFNDCCYTPRENACDLCKGRDVRLDKQTTLLGSKTACSGAIAWYNTMYDNGDDVCINSAQVAMDCCYTKCTICGDLQPDWEKSVSFSGEDLTCKEIDVLFQQESVALASPRCQMSRDLYAEDCCLQTLESPCDLCNTQKSGKYLKRNETVSYEGSISTCLGVYTHLFSSVEKDTNTCTRAQKDLVGQCCESSASSDSSGTSFDRAPEPVKNKSPTPMPAPTEDTLSANWYAGSLESSSSASSTDLLWEMTAIAMALLVVPFWLL